MSFELIDTREQKADIKVVGVGGCGNNAIEYMIHNKVSGVDFICVNTDLFQHIYLHMGMNWSSFPIC